MKKVQIVQEEGAVIEQPVLARAIMDISAAMKELLRSGLNRRAIICLMHGNTVGLGKHDIEVVLDSLESLADDYTSRRAKGGTK